MKTLFGIIPVLMASMAFGQADQDNCKDHPLLKRVPNSYITQCSKGNDQVEFAIDDTTNDIKGGDRFLAQYAFQKSSTPAPKFSQVITNFETPILANGGKRIYASEKNGTATYMIPSKGKELWIMVNDRSGDALGGYEVVTIDVNLSKKVTAMSMYEDLMSKGRTKPGIQFLPGKSVISDESIPVIDVIADMMNTTGDLSIIIEAHTDENASAPTNKSLSEDRARAVSDILATKGVDKSKMKISAMGNSKPLTDDKSDDGRAKNSRIEIVNADSNN